MVTDAIKYTSNIFLSAGRSRHKVCLFRWGLLSKGKFQKIENVFSSFATEYIPLFSSSQRYFQFITPLLLPAPTLTAMPFAMTLWSFQSRQVELCSLVLKLSLKEKDQCNCTLFVFGLLTISQKFATHVMWQGSFELAVYSPVCLWLWNKQILIYYIPDCQTMFVSHFYLCVRYVGAERFPC